MRRENVRRGGGRQEEEQVKRKVVTYSLGFLWKLLVYG